MKAFSFSRRDFLASAGFLIVTIQHIGKNAGAQAQTAIAGASAPRSDLAIDEIDSYLAIGGDGSIAVSTGRIDMGTGNRTCFMQFVADELDVALDRIHIVAGDTELTPDGGKTTASNGVPIGSQPLRVSAATARHRLLQLASERLGVPADGTRPILTEDLHPKGLAGCLQGLQ